MPASSVPGLASLIRKCGLSSQVGAKAIPTG